MTISEAGRFLLQQLQPAYDSREAANISNLILENITGLQNMDRVLKKDVHLDLDSERLLNQYIIRLRNYEPVQYVLSEAWFFGFPFYTDKNVLIPRPETEELVQWIINDNEARQELSIFDVGTGSGCIPISLKKKLKTANIYSCDISDGALTVAKRNAAALNADISFRLLNVLDRNTWTNIPPVQIIVSNPPYIPLTEKISMGENVVAHEPLLALFVDDDDPLVFYKAIAELGTQKLFPSGAVYVETHEAFARETARVFESAPYDKVEIRTDMQGKQRMIKASLLHADLVNH